MDEIDHRFTDCNIKKGEESKSKVKINQKLQFKNKILIS